MYEAYDNLSPDTPGFTKTDALVAQGVLNKLRDQRISEETIDMYKPWARMIYDGVMTLPAGDQARQNFEYYIDYGFEDAIWDDFANLFH